MYKILFWAVCFLLPLCLLCACSQPAQEKNVSHGYEADSPALYPEEVLEAFAEEVSPRKVTTVCQGILLPDTELSEVREAFLQNGYQVIETASSYGRLRPTAVLESSSWLVTLIPEADGSLQVLWESVDEISTVPLRPDETAVQGDVTLVQVGIERKGQSDNPMIGMCYVYRLADGSAVIIDGGFATDVCTENLYRTLEKLDIAKNEDGKYRITAWIITHSHEDHIGAFQSFSYRYSDKTDLTYIVNSFPDGYTENLFDNSVRENYPKAHRVCPHAGLQYTFGNLTLHMLYTLDLLESDGYFNNTSLLFRAEANGQSVLHFGDAGEKASEEAWTSNSPEAFESSALQITHHGLYTGGESHEWNYLGKIYEATGASVGLLPMGTRCPGDARNGRYTVMGEWGSAGFQISYVTDQSDRHGVTLTQSDFDKFVSDVAQGTSEHATLLGYDGVNLLKNGNGMTTYLSASENDPMATVFTLSETGFKVVSNTELTAWLEP